MHNTLYDHRFTNSNVSSREPITPLMTDTIFPGNGHREVYFISTDRPAPLYDEGRVEAGINVQESVSSN